MKSIKTGIINASIFLILVVFPASVKADGNKSNDSFNKAKKILESVYSDHRITFYCNAVFDSGKNITLPDGFFTEKYKNRIKKIEWEHIVPAENFGRAFSEWRDGHPKCVDSKGKAFKGRKCAEKANMEYRYMQSDMHNLVPAIGSVNASRQNYNFEMLPGEKSDFGTCPMKISGNKAEPPEWTRGAIARTYKYMQSTYPKYRMGRPQQQLMDAWDKMYPPTEWECKREERISKLQGNRNPIVVDRCAEMN